MATERDLRGIRLFLSLHGREKSRPEGDSNMDGKAYTLTVIR